MILVRLRNNMEPIVIKEGSIDELIKEIHTLNLRDYHDAFFYERGKFENMGLYGDTYDYYKMYDCLKQMEHDLDIYKKGVITDPEEIRLIALNNESEKYHMIPSTYQIYGLYPQIMKDFSKDPSLLKNLTADELDSISINDLKDNVIETIISNRHNKIKITVDGKEQRSDETERENN